MPENTIQRKFQQLILSIISTWVASESALCMPCAQFAAEKALPRSLCVKDLCQMPLRSTEQAPCQHRDAVENSLCLYRDVYHSSSAKQYVSKSITSAVHGNFDRMRWKALDGNVCLNCNLRSDGYVAKPCGRCREQLPRLSKRPLLCVHSCHGIVD